MSKFSALKGIMRDGWDAHHLFPQQCESDPLIAPALGQLRSCGFSLNDFHTNGILLPANGRLARETGLPHHRRGHADYNKHVIDRMKRIVDPYRRRALSLRDRAVLIPALRCLQGDLRATLLRPHAGVELHIDEVLISGITDEDIFEALKAHWPERMARPAH